MLGTWAVIEPESDEEFSAVRQARRWLGGVRSVSLFTPSSVGRRRWPPVVFAHGSSDERGKIDAGVRPAQLWLEVALVKAVEHGVGHEHDQPENKDGVGMMMEAVTGMPAGDQFVEAFVFDLPTIVSEVEDGLPSAREQRHGRGPPPVAVDGSFDPFSGDALAASAGLVGMDHAQLGADGFGAEALGLLQDDVSRGFAGRGPGCQIAPEGAPPAAVAPRAAGGCAPRPGVRVGWL